MRLWGWITGAFFLLACSFSPAMASAADKVIVSDGPVSDYLRMIGFLYFGDKSEFAKKMPKDYAYWQKKVMGNAEFKAQLKNLNFIGLRARFEVSFSDCCEQDFDKLIKFLSGSPKDIIRSAAQGLTHEQYLNMVIATEEKPYAALVKLLKLLKAAGFESWRQELTKKATVQPEFIPHDKVLKFLSRIQDFSDQRVARPEDVHYYTSVFTTVPAYRLKGARILLSREATVSDLEDLPSVFTNLVVFDPELIKKVGHLNFAFPLRDRSLNSGASSDEIGAIYPALWCYLNWGDSAKFESLCKIAAVRTNLKVNGSSIRMGSPVGLAMIDWMITQQRAKKKIRLKDLTDYLMDKSKTEDWFLSFWAKSAQPYLGLTGVAVKKAEGKLIVAFISPSLPAEKAGIKVGDWISAIDGGSTNGMEIEDFLMKAAGPRGSSVRFTIGPKASEHTVQLTRM